MNNLNKSKILQKIHFHTNEDFSFIPVELKEDLEVAMECCQNPHFKSLSFFIRDISNHPLIVKLWVAHHSDCIHEDIFHFFQNDEISLFIIGMEYPHIFIDQRLKKIINPIHYQQLIHHNAKVLKYFTQPDLEISLLLQTIEKNPFFIKELEEDVRNLSVIALNAVKHNPMTLSLFNDRVRNSPQIVYQAIKDNPFYFQYAGDLLKNNAQFYNEYIPQLLPYSILEHASPYLLNNKVFMKPFLENDLSLLKYCHEGILSDKDYLFQLLKDYKNSHQYFETSILQQAFHSFDPLLLNDKEFILNLATIIELPLIYPYLSSELQNDKTFFLESVYKNNYHEELFKHLGSSLRNDLDVISLLLNETHLFKYVGKDLLNNKDFCLKALEQYQTTIFEYFSEELRNDPQIIYTAYQKCIVQDPNKVIELFIPYVEPEQLSQELWEEWENYHTIESTMTKFSLFNHLNEDLTVHSDKQRNKI